MIAAAEFRHLQHVTVTDAYGKSTTGRLNLPDVLMYGRAGNYWESRVLTAGYQTVTLILPDGSLFHTEGRLS